MTMSLSKTLAINSSRTPWGLREVKREGMSREHLAPLVELGNNHYNKHSSWRAFSTRQKPGASHSPQTSLCYGWKRVSGNGIILCQALIRRAAGAVWDIQTAHSISCTHAHTHNRTERVREKQAVLTNTGCGGGQSRPDDSQHTQINKMAVHRNQDMVQNYNTVLWFYPLSLYTYNN